MPEEATAVKTPQYAVKSAVKTRINDRSLHVRGDVYDALNQKIDMILHEAMNRAAANGRSTLMVQDV